VRARPLGHVAAARGYDPPLMRTSMRRFWDARAREDAYYFIDNNGRYRNADREAFWSSGDETLDYMLSRVGGEIQPTDSIVEIGCGIGRVTRALARRGGDVRAFDVSAEMIAKARVENPQLDNVEWLVGDGASLRPVDDASADVVHSFVVFQHIPDPEITMSYVREIGRVLRPDGWAFFQVSNLPDVHRPRPRRERLRRCLRARLGHAPRGQSNPAWLGSYIELDHLRDVVAESGMTIDAIAGEGTQFCIVRARKLAPSVGASA
jgi:SAM-dependent methyltransferase